MRRVLVTMVAVLALAACSGVDEGERVGTGAQPSSDQPATAAPAQANVVGDKVALRNGDTVQVRSYTANVPPPDRFTQPGAGMAFAVADVEGCAKEASPTGVVNPFFFELQMPDNTRVDATFQTVKSPGLNASAMAPGDCIRGNVAFEVPTAAKPVAVVFGAFGTSVKWNIP